MKSFQKLIGYFCLIVSLLVAPEWLCAQGTAFTYQGRLNDSGSPANGSYDLSFQLFNAATNGTAVGPMLTNSATGVSNGLFIVTLDFGTGIFTGPDYWLEIGVRTNGSAGAFTTLAPLQELMPTPYAVYASTASAISGPLTSADLSGLYTNALILNNSNNVFAGNGSSLTNVNANTVGGFNAAQFWNLTGNAGTIPGVNFVGTTDNEPLQIWANGSRVFLLDGTADPSAPNVIGGSVDNSVAPFFITDTIAGGAENTIQGDSSTIGGGAQNTCGDDGCTIAGGDQNTIQSATYCSTIAGGYDNTIGVGGFGSAIGGGDQNTCSGNGCTIGGGVGNTCQGGYATIGGGSQNTCSDGGCTIAGGQQNTIQTDAGFSTIAGGGQNTIQNDTFAGTIAGGLFNTIESGADGSTIAGGGFMHANLIQSNAMESVIGGGCANSIGIGADSSVIAGGLANSIQAGAEYAVIPGGLSNLVAGIYSFAAGQQAHATNQGAFVWADSQDAPFASTNDDSFNIRARGGVLLTDGHGNTASWTPGSGSWNFASDRNLKDRFAPVDDASVLDKVSKLPLTEWSYKGHGQRHIGAMAQDFHTLFPLNDNDKVLNETDLHGVELAAIKGLNQKVNAKDGEIQTLKQENEALQKRLEALEQAVGQLLAKK